jgi:hypothetical protein
VNFPLYLYPDRDKKDLFSHKEGTVGRKPNINPEFFAILSNTYNNVTDRNVCPTCPTALLAVSN